MISQDRKLWRASALIGYDIHATDDSIGSVSDILFDDAGWTLRWLVVDTGSWLPGRKVLLPTSVLGQPDVARRSLPVDATRRQVEESPGIGHDEPVSRQMETDVYGHYGWSPYWYPGTAAFPGFVPPLPAAAAASGPVSAPRQSGDPHLRSVKEVTGYHIRATDGDIGHVEEFLLDDAGWTIRYIVADTRNWWPGRKVLVAPKWIREVDWGSRLLHVGITRQQVETSPEYDPSATTDRAYEERLHGHYGQIPYWA
jgi:hypothetical protein